MKAFYLQENARIVRNAIRSMGIMRAVRYLSSVWRTKRTQENHPPQPLHTIIEITTHCNLRCPTCAQPTYQKEKKNLSLEKFLHILDSIPQTQKISLLGLGEPFLNKNLSDFIRESKRRRKHVLIYSNATCLTPSNREMILNEGLDAIHLSIDGARKETFERLRLGAAFDKTMEMIKALSEERMNRRSKLRMILAFTATMENVRELPEMIELAARLGVPELVLNDIHYFREESVEKKFGSDTLHHYRSQVDQMVAAAAKKAKQLGIAFYTNMENARGIRTCLYPWLETFVSISGHVTPCCLNGWDPDPLNFGSIYEESFSSIWHSEGYVTFRQQMKSPNRPPLCVNCPGYGREMVKWA